MPQDATDRIVYPATFLCIMPSAPHPIATRTVVETVLRCDPRARKMPLFLPAIYEHKAAFIGSTPSAISRDADLLTRAMLAELKVIGPDALAVGVDVYNLEAEAVGCEVSFYEGDDTSIPGIKPGNHVIKVGDDLSNAPLPHPLKDGRMPINITAAANLRREIGDDYWIRGAISGPFSLAISLVGAEDLFMACLDEPAWVEDVLAYSGRVIKAFARAYIDVGVELLVFDSQASPELLSPTMYEKIVLPATQDLVTWAAENGVRDLPLIVGGNTTSIATLLAASGANNLLCDFTADFDEWAQVCSAHGRALRRNISPHLIETGTPEEAYEVAAREIARGQNLPGFILGTAVVPFGSPTANLLAIKQACLDSAKA